MSSCSEDKGDPREFLIFWPLVEKNKNVKAQSGEEHLTAPRHSCVWAILSLPFEVTLVCWGSARTWPIVWCQDWKLWGEGGCPFVMLISRLPAGSKLPSPTSNVQTLFYQNLQLKHKLTLFIFKNGIFWTIVLDHEPQCHGFLEVPLGLSENFIPDWLWNAGSYILTLPDPYRFLGS